MLQWEEHDGRRAGVVFPGQQEIREKRDEGCGQEDFRQGTNTVREHVGPTGHRADGNHIGGLGLIDCFLCLFKFRGLLAERPQHRADFLGILGHGVYEGDGAAVRDIGNPVERC